jgi:hypothetical protein
LLFIVVVIRAMRARESRSVGSASTRN